MTAACYPKLFTGKEATIEDRLGTQKLEPKTFRKVCGVQRGNWNLTLITLVFIAYLVGGAFVFQFIELETERYHRAYLSAFYTDFWHNNSCVRQDDLEELIRKVVDATNKGFSASLNGTTELNWSFGQSFFFAGTLVSTVGYGHVSPLTQGGKAFTIIYALIGIPLTLALLTAFVERLKAPSLWCLSKLNTKFGHLYQAAQIRFAHLAVMLSFVLVFMFLIPSAIFVSLEPSWTYLDAFYYCFISLTTVGLGDYIPGDQPNQENRALYKVFTTIYLFIGICCMLLLLSTLYDIPQLNFSNFFIVRSDYSNDPERINFAEQGISGPRYSRQVDDRDGSFTPTPGVNGSREDSTYQMTNH